MGIVVIPSLIPKPFTGWSTAGNFWRTNGSVCPQDVTINCTNVIYGAVFGGWWANYIGFGPGFVACGGSDPYVLQLTGSQFNINVWGALGAGLWSSSVAIQYHGRRNSVAAPAIAGTVSAEPVARAFDPTATPAPISLGVTVPGGVFAGCPAPNLLATLTFYDDGTYSIA